MRIVWDEPNRLANLAKHGMDFAGLEEEFFENATVVPANDGRSIAIGRHLGSNIVVVFAPLGREAIGVISMRLASRRERTLVR
jgi:uncharacterized DUF497 family protein